MARATAAALCALACLAFAAGAGAGPLKVGVADDTGKYAADCGLAFYGRMNDIGFTVDRVTVLWDETRPSTIVEQSFLDRTVPCAERQGIKLVFDVFPLHPTGISADPITRSAQFVAWLQKVARRYPTVTNVIVGNEPNVNRFWQPVASGPAQFEALLALAYDALKSVNPAIDVIGVGLSPRGNDNPGAASNPSLSPVNFIAQLANAYRASGRTRPLMDEFSFHPYANLNNEPYSKGYQWPNAGGANFDRIKQAFWDGFHDTGQKVFAEQAGARATQAAGADDTCAAPVTSRVLCMNLDEAGTQTTTSGHGGYTGAEAANLVPQLVDEATQARYYTELLGLAACDPSVESLLFFDFVDETPLDRWQSGELYADGTKKQSYGAIQRWLRATGGRCPGRVVGWRHATGVVGVKALVRLPAVVASGNTYWTFGVSATEDASYQAWIAADASGGVGAKIATAAGSVRAYYSPLVRFPARTLATGCYRFGITLAAAMNPARQTTLEVSRFCVGAAGAAAGARPGRPSAPAKPSHEKPAKPSAPANPANPGKPGKADKPAKPDKPGKKK